MLPFVSKGSSSYCVESSKRAPSLDHFLLRGWGRCQSVSNTTISMFGRTKREGMRPRKKCRSMFISRLQKMELARSGAPRDSRLPDADQSRNHDNSRKSVIQRQKRQRPAR